MSKKDKTRLKDKYKDLHVSLLIIMKSIIKDIETIKDTNTEVYNAIMSSLTKINKTLKTLDKFINESSDNVSDNEPINVLTNEKIGNIEMKELINDSKLIEATLHYQNIINTLKIITQNLTTIKQGESK